MVTSFNRKDLVSFGNYLLSEERRELFKQHPDLGENQLEERLANVHHADFSNWMYKVTKGNTDYLFEDIKYPVSTFGEIIKIEVIK